MAEASHEAGAGEPMETEGNNQRRDNEGLWVVQVIEVWEHCEYKYSFDVWEHCEYNLR